MTGVLVVAVGIAVLVTPSTTANPRGGRALAGLESAGTVYAPTSGDSTAAFDVPDVKWPARRDPTRALRGGSFVDRVGRRAPGEIVDGQDYLTTFSVYSDDIGQTGQFFQIDAPGLFTASPRDQCAQEATVWCQAAAFRLQ